MKPFVQERTLSSVDIYMSEVSRYPLLDAPKEVKLAIQYERGRAAERQLGSGQLEAPQRAVLERAVARGHRARQRLIQCNLRLVPHLIRQYIGCGLPFADLVQEGNMGLMEAVERFDHRRGVRFATYAGWWIRQTVLRALASQGRTIRLPAGMRDELIRLKKARARLETRLRRLPACDELAAEMGISRQRVRQLQSWDRQVVSLDMPVGEMDDAVLSDVIPDRTAPPLDEAVVHQQLEDQLRTVMGRYLTVRDRTLLSLRFGLGDDQKRTLREVAGVLGISQERAC